jgi:FkbM family methyltransferase
MIKPLVRLIFPRSFRMQVACWRFHLDRRRQVFLGDYRTLGLFAALTLTLSSLASRSIRKNGGALRLRRLLLDGYQYPLFFRECTSDAEVIRQVFGRNEYACIGDEEDIACIIDCGANIGCTSFYFLSRYPRARLIAIEPDRENFELCRRNLRPFGKRATVLQAGIWSEALPLRVERGKFMDGKEWSFQVRPCEANETPDLHSTTMPRLIALAGGSRVDILKMDIEASEKVIFRAPTRQWLKSIRHLVIELHDKECEEAFWQATSEFDCRVERSGELTLCKHLSPRSSAYPAPACRPA